MKTSFSKANVIVENRKNGIQPAMFIVEDDRVYMITITPDHQFCVSDEGLVGERYNKLGQWCGKE